MQLQQVADAQLGLRESCQGEQSLREVVVDVVETLRQVGPLLVADAHRLLRGQLQALVDLRLLQVGQQGVASLLGGLDALVLQGEHVRLQLYAVGGLCVVLPPCLGQLLAQGRELAAVLGLLPSALLGLLLLLTGQQLQLLAVGQLLVPVVAPRHPGHRAHQEQRRGEQPDEELLLAVLLLQTVALRLHAVEVVAGLGALGLLLLLLGIHRVLRCREPLVVVERRRKVAALPL